MVEPRHVDLSWTRHPRSRTDGVPGFPNVNARFKQAGVAPTFIYVSPFCLNSWLMRCGRPE